MLELLELLHDDAPPGGAEVGAPVVVGTLDDVADGGPVVDGATPVVVAAESEVSGEGSSSLQAATATAIASATATAGSVLVVLVP